MMTAKNVTFHERYEVFSSLRVLYKHISRNEAAFSIVQFKQFDVSLSLNQSAPEGVSAIGWECIRVTCRAQIFLKSLKIFNFKYSLQNASQSESSGKLSSDYHF